jgi:hypothetical protein
MPPSKATDASAWIEKSSTTTLFDGLDNATAAAVCEVRKDLPLPPCVQATQLSLPRLQF